MIEAGNARGNIRIVNHPGPGVARISVGITGAESSTDSLQPWNFTPIGLAMNAAAYAGGVNSQTPALLSRKQNYRYSDQTGFRCGFDFRPR
ncbi:DUF3313 family protein [Polynucleobacter necessarius]|uniref:DUF3313 family protein n=1 Tax=Polynucleobacter necessarius TaxID=576610 RepID=UPI0018D4F727